METIWPQNHQKMSFRASKRPWKFETKLSILGPRWGHASRNNQRADCSDITDPDLCVNELKEHIQSHNNRHFAKIKEIE